MNSEHDGPEDSGFLGGLPEEIVQKPSRLWTFSEFNTVCDLIFDPLTRSDDGRKIDDEAEKKRLERVLHFHAEEAVLCKYIQALSLGLQRRYSKPEEQEPAIPAMSAMRSGSLVHRI